MNIYRVIEDGQDSCIKAKTMSEAVKICEDSYIEDRLELFNTDDNQDVFEQHEREHYQQNVLKSCELLGELKN